MSMRVLVAYASKEGATAEIAEVIADELRKHGFEATARPAGGVKDLSPFGAVILGSAIYLGHWRHEALRFGERHGVELLDRPVWLFDSGPLHQVPAGEQHEPVVAADDLATRIGARERVTFGGRLTPEQAGFMTRHLMASGKAGSFGDFRDLDRIRNWARSIASQLHELETRLSALPPAPVPEPDVPA